MRTRHKVEELGVDVECVQAVVVKITNSLDELIDKCNNDLRFKHPTLSEREGYLPIRKSPVWPQFDAVSGAYAYIIAYDEGAGESTGGLYISYFPNPLKSLEFAIKDGLPDVAGKIKEEWKSVNPTIDLSRGLYQLRGVVSNSYSDVLNEVSLRFEQLAESRKTGK